MLRRVEREKGVCVYVCVFVGGVSSSAATSHVVISLISFFISFLTSFERYEMSTMLMAAEIVNMVGAGRFITLL